MKKIIFISFLISIFSFSFLFSLNTNNIVLDLASNYNSQVSFFVTDNINNKEINQINNGIHNIVLCNSNTAYKTYDKLKSVVGISFSFLGKRTDFINICEKLNIVIKSKEIINDEITSYLCYTKKIRNHINVDNEKINIQIAVNKDIITVGTPIILGSF